MNPPLTMLPNLENDTKLPPNGPADLPVSTRAGRESPDGYLPDPGCWMRSESCYCFVGLC